ncbi:MAG: dihydroxyacetone kinase subunit L [Bacteroidetes bacterium]|nr:MAG: dihydroxyacetone kinase subunit L [Bacteroidota bacterium]
MEVVKNSEAVQVLERMNEAIQENKQYLCEIDGAIADGDHGINMSKGFRLTLESPEQERSNLSQALLTLARVLMMRIGGSMGPLYGRFFRSMGKSLSDKTSIDATDFGEALEKAKADMSLLTQAKPGDKTLIDALYPGIAAYQKALKDGKGFKACLMEMKRATESGRDATSDMVANIGRSRRLGERSKGVVDAGAASCALLLGAMADGLSGLL